jgi:lipoprotein NlpD
MSGVSIRGTLSFVTRQRFCTRVAMTQAPGQVRGMGNGAARPCRGGERWPLPQRQPAWCALIVLVVCFLASCSTTPPAPAPVEDLEAPALPTTERPTDTYQVLRGDTLYSIAWRAGLDYQKLAEWNGIRRPYVIHPGQELRLSAPAGAAVGVAKLEPKVAGSPSSRKKNRRLSKRKPAATLEHRDLAEEGSGATEGSLHWQWPTEGRVTQPFTPNDRAHQGIKIAGRLGQSVLAAESGKIVYSGSGLVGYGQLIIIEHNKNFLSAYGHNKNILVKEGATVARGERIAEMGNSADGVPILHFEIRRNGDPVNPLKLLPKRS